MTKTQNLTDRKFWVDYWRSKPDLIFKIPNNYPFLEELKKIFSERKPSNAIEIGGFPGYYPVWINKNFKIPSTLLDYVIETDIINKLEIKNGLKSNSIRTIETDIFQFETKENYSLVISVGLIEHFENISEILEIHKSLLAEDGTLFITIPNFKSLNGWFQKIFDYENYIKHNISIMDLKVLREKFALLGLKDIDVRYSGKFMLWLENEQDKPVTVRLLRKIIWLPLKILTKIIPIETKALSPYIIATGHS